MRGTGLVAVSARPVYGYVAQIDGSIRFKVASREWDGLEVEPGQLVAVRLPGQGERALLVASVTPLDEWVWVFFTRPVAAWWTRVGGDSM